MGILREAEFVNVDAVPQKLFDALADYESALSSHSYLDFHYDNDESIVLS
jgi:hypothetical protein